MHNNEAKVVITWCIKLLIRNLLA